MFGQYSSKKIQCDSYALCIDNDWKEFVWVHYKKTNWCEWLVQLPRLMFILCFVLRRWTKYYDICVFVLLNSWEVLCPNRNYYNHSYSRWLRATDRMTDLFIVWYWKVTIDDQVRGYPSQWIYLVRLWVTFSWCCLVIWHDVRLWCAHHETIFLQHNMTRNSVMICWSWDYIYVFSNGNVPYDIIAIHPNQIYLVSSINEIGSIWLQNI